MEKGGRVTESVQGVESLRVPEKRVVDVEQVGIQGGLIELVTKIDIVSEMTRSWLSATRDRDADPVMNVSGVGPCERDRGSVINEKVYVFTEESKEFRSSAYCGTKSGQAFEAVDISSVKRDATKKGTVPEDSCFEEVWGVNWFSLSAMATKDSVIALFLDLRRCYVPERDVSPIKGDSPIKIAMMFANSLCNGGVSVSDNGVCEVGSQSDTELLECSQSSQGSKYRRRSKWLLVSLLVMLRSGVIKVYQRSERSHRAAGRAPS
jgi:hypothetical protein